MTSVARNFEARLGVKEKHGDIIINQLKKLGCSCDWTASGSRWTRIFALRAESFRRTLQEGPHLSRQNAW